MVTCLVCETALEDVGGLHRCPECGYVYPPEILAQANSEAWKRIQSEHLACTECEQNLPGIPRVWADKHGQPKPCPIHAKRVFWRRWFRLGFSKRSRNITPAG